MKVYKILKVRIKIKTQLNKMVFSKELNLTTKCGQRMNATAKPGDVTHFAAPGVCIGSRALFTLQWTIVSLIDDPVTATDKTHCCSR